MGLPVSRPPAEPAREQPEETSDLYERSSERLLPSVARLLAVLLVASVITTAVALLRYAPLSGGTPVAAEGSGVTLEAPGRYTAAFQPNGSFEYRFALRNAGRWGVTVTGLHEPAHPVIEDVEVLAAAPGSSSFAPMEPFALRAGDQAEILVRVRFGVCATPPPQQSRDVWDRETVTFRVLGVSRQMSVALPMRIAMDGGAAPSC